MCLGPGAVGVAPDFWMLYCPTCRVLIGEPIPGTERLNLEEEPDSVADPYWQMEGRLSQAHAAEETDQPEGFAELLTKAAWKTW